VSSSPVGFIGLGIMGSRMAANLRGAGLDLVVWNRTTETAERWAAMHGAEVASSPAAVGERCEIVITMVVDGPQVEAVLLGGDGVAQAARPGLLCVDMSTIGRSWARRIGAALAERKLGFVDAPVTGSAPKAEDGTLTIMAGGEPAGFERARPLFEAMGGLVLHVGPVGDGQMVKLINNAVAASNAAVLAQGLLLARRAGLDLQRVVEVMAAGAGGSVMLALKSKPMIDRDYPTLFKLEHMLKDVRLCLQEAEDLGLGDAVGYFTETERILAEAERHGLGERDFAALYEVVAERA
jgi:3-hydroxyisobutyrate dehydrogenase-like beta-hydroxyacid dehydrogenase